VIPAMIQGANLTLTHSDAMDLHVRALNGVITSAWEPTPDEIAAIVAGVKIHLHLLGNTHPPVVLTVGDTP
jgi:hypothetical protein